MTSVTSDTELGFESRYHADVILVTGASGKTGRAIVSALADTGSSVRGLVHRTEQVTLLEEIGATDVVRGDIRDPAVLEAAMAGVEACYHICPNVHPEEVSIGAGAIAAAQTARVQKFVFHSVLHPQTRQMPHHWAKLQVEERLFESNLEFTILQPCAYMQNTLASWKSIVEQGVFRVPYRPETRVSLVDLDDVASIARLVLTESGHSGAIYELCGPEKLTQVDIAATLAKVLGRPVEVVVESIDDWSERARRSGVGDQAIATLVQMFEYYDRFGFWGNSGVSEYLLGRPLTSFREFSERTLATFK